MSTTAQQRFVYINGEVVAEEKAVISPFDRGFLWGDGAYEITPCFNGRPFRLGEHLDRLQRSLRFIRIDLGLNREEIERATARVLDANSTLLASNTICKLGHWVTRGSETLGMTASDSGPPTLFIFCWPVTRDETRAEHYRTGVRLTVVPTRRNSPQSIDPRAKVTSKMNQILAELDAGPSGAMPLMLDIHGNIAEGNIFNFFIVKEGVLVTPPTNGILEGITRNLVFELSSRLGIDAFERAFALYDVAQADEYFLTQSTVGVLPIRQVGPYQPEAGAPGPVTQQLMKTFAEETGVALFAG